jgi:hypothetical protein
LAAEDNILAEIAGIVTQMGRFNERVKFLSPRLRRIRTELQRLDASESNDE